MSFQNEMKFVVSNDAISQEVSGEMVILDLTSELYFGLNNTGLRIWQLLEAGKNTGEVLAALLLEFDVPSEQLRKDLFELLEALMSAGLIAPEKPMQS